MKNVTVEKRSQTRSSYTYVSPVLFLSPYPYLKYKYQDVKSGKMITSHMRLSKVVKSCNSKTDADKKIRAEKIALEQKLKSGWTPSGYHVTNDCIIDVLDLYFTKMKAKLRPLTYLNYISTVGTFKKWLASHHYSNMSVVEFGSHECLEYSDYLQNLGLKTISYNEYISKLSNIWNWMSKKRLIPVDNYWKNLREPHHETKKRLPISSSDDKKILSWIRENNPVMEIVIQLIYQCFIRPGEIVKLKIKDIDMIHDIIYVPAEVSKTKRIRTYYLPKDVKSLLMLYGFNDSDSECNLIGFGRLRHTSRENKLHTQLCVGRHVVKNIVVNNLDDVWSYLRNDIGLSSSYQLYSYRDSSIQDLAMMGLPNEYIKMLTGHVCTDTIRIYESHRADSTRQKLVTQFTRPVGQRDVNHEYGNIKKIFNDKII